MLLRHQQSKRVCVRAKIKKRKNKKAPPHDDVRGRNSEITSSGINGARYLIHSRGKAIRKIGDVDRAARHDTGRRIARVRTCEDKKKEQESVSTRRRARP